MKTNNFITKTLSNVKIDKSRIKLSIEKNIIKKYYNIERGYLAYYIDIKGEPVFELRPNQVITLNLISCLFADNVPRLSRGYTHQCWSVAVLLYIMFEEKYGLK